MPTGTATISFGSTPETEASATVTGQSTITSTSLIEAWVMGATTSDNNETDHLFAGVSFRVTCGIPVTGVGFTIYVACISGLATGDFKVQWVWN